MATSNIPLKCTICPKKPKFSDVSHLLTHVASKGHLSHYYKVKVRSSSDLVSRDMIETYDNWYSDWRVEELMSQRMHVKDRRRNNRSRNQAAAKPEPLLRPRQAQTAIDPQLTEPTHLYTTSNQVSMNGLPRMQDYQAYPGLQPPPKKHKPRLHLWSTTRPSSFDSIALESSSPEFCPRPQTHRSIDHVVPTAYMGSRARVFHNEEEEGEEEEEGTATEATKLKGIFWPGMDIFDAATPDMKRKRNQKKDISVVEQLEQSSLMVEATEMIFTPQGSLKKERPISGQVEYDSSPYKLDIPSPLRRRTARKPLVEQDPNSLSVLLLPDSLSRFYVPAADTLNSIGETTTRRRGNQKRNFVVYQDEPEDPFYEPAQMRHRNSECHLSQMMAANNTNDTSFLANSPLHDQVLFDSSRVSFAHTQSATMDSVFFDLPYYGLQELKNYSAPTLPPYEQFFPPYRPSKPGQAQIKPIKDEFDDSLTILISSDN